MHGPVTHNHEGISDQLAKLAESPKQHQAKTETHQRVPPKSPLSSPRAPSERVPALGLQAAVCGSEYSII